MEMRNIKMVVSATGEQFELELQTFRVPVEVTEVCMDVDASTLPAMLEAKIQAYVEKTCLQMVEDARASGQEVELVSFIEALEGDPDLHIPRQFPKALRQDIGHLASFMRKSKRDPQSLIKGCLVGTDHGLLLQLWVLVEEINLYSNLVTPVTTQLEVSVPTVAVVAVDQGVGTLAAASEVVQPAVEPTPQVEVVLIHPSDKPLIVMRKDGSVPQAEETAAEEPTAVTQTVAVEQRMTPHQSSVALMERLSRRYS